MPSGETPCYLWGLRCHLSLFFALGRRHFLLANEALKRAEGKACQQLCVTHIKLSRLQCAVFRLDVCQNTRTPASKTLCTVSDAHVGRQGRVEGWRAGSAGKGACHQPDDLNSVPETCSLGGENRLSQSWLLASAHKHLSSLSPQRATDIKFQILQPFYLDSKPGVLQGVSEPHTCPRLAQASSFQDG